MSQPRFNPKTGQNDRYYRIKESFRDRIGRQLRRVRTGVERLGLAAIIPWAYTMWLRRSMS